MQEYFSIGSDQETKNIWKVEKYFEQEEYGGFFGWGIGRNIEWNELERQAHQPTF